MSRLLVVTRQALLPGFQLAGVNAYAAEDVETAQEIIETWLESGEVGLLAIDDGLLEHMDTTFLKRLDSAENLPHLSIPGGKPLGPGVSRMHHIAEMIRRAIGFHITFKDVEVEE